VSDAIGEQTVSGNRADPQAGRGWELIAQGDAARMAWLNRAVKSEEASRELGPPPVPKFERPAPPPTERRAVDEERNCSVCGKKLHGNNTTGSCKPCRKAAPAEAPDDDAAPVEIRVPSTPPRIPRAKPQRDVAERFAVLTELLDLDREEVLEELMGAWLETIKAKLTDAA
jgi:hypothetical protein